MLKKLVKKNTIKKDFYNTNAKITKKIRVDFIKKSTSY
jgi:hypothetical protein